MNPLRTTLAALLLPLCAHAAPAITNAWVSRLDAPLRPFFAVQRGETVALDCTLLARGTNAVAFPAGTVATFYWQTNGMGSAWWSTNATVAPGGRLGALWTPAMDPGADAVSAYIGAVAPGGEIAYRAAATLRFIHAPGEAPNSLPLPVPFIDFGAVAVENAPWALPGDIPVTSVNGKTGDVVIDAEDVGATLTEAASAWVFADGLLEVAQENLARFLPSLATDSHLELSTDGELWCCENGHMCEDGEDHGRNFAVVTVDGLSALMRGGVDWATTVVPPGGTVATRSSTTGYQLGQQADKPLAKDADLQAHKADATAHVTAQEKAAWNGKQDAIPDLSTIRSGAAAGATAYQRPWSGIPASDLAIAVQGILIMADSAVQPNELGTAAAKDVPVIGNAANGEVVLGSDTRLANARTPTAHKSTHSTGGSDALSPTDIGALPTNGGTMTGNISFSQGGGIFLDDVLLYGDGEEVHFSGAEGGIVIKYKDGASSVAALLEDVAPAYSSGTAYALNQLCVKDNALKKCTTAGTGSAAAFANATVEDVLADLRTALAGKADSPNLATVATSGSYNDLTDKPTNVSTFTNDVGYLTSYTDVTNAVRFVVNSDSVLGIIHGVSTNQVRIENCELWIDGVRFARETWTFALTNGTTAVKTVLVGEAAQ